MAREARKLSSTGMYFVSLKGECLFRSNADKAVFVELLEKYFAEGEVYGYELTKTEITLVVKESPKGISMTMKPLTTSYARYFNRTYEISGKLFADRFKSIPIESEEEKEEFLADMKNPPKKKAAPKKASPKKENKVKPAKKTVGDNKKETIKQEKAVEKVPEKKEEPKKLKRRSMPSYLL